MLATLTSKGQLTLPKQIRESLGLQPGSRLDFSIGTAGETKGMLVARPLTNTALGLAGLLKRPGKATVSLWANCNPPEAISTYGTPAPAQMISHKRQPILARPHPSRKTIGSNNKPAQANRRAVMSNGDSEVVTP